MHGGVDGLVHAGGAQQGGQFAATSVGQHGMEEVSRRDHGTADQPKTLLGHHVFELGLRDDVRMADGILTVPVHEGVKTLEVVIIHLFPLSDTIVQLVGIGPPAKEGVLRVQGLQQAMLLEELLDGGVGLVLTFPLTFPDGFHKVPVLAEQAVFSLAGLEHRPWSCPDGGDVVPVFAGSKWDTRARSTRRIRTLC